MFPTHLQAMGDPMRVRNDCQHLRLLVCINRTYFFSKGSQRVLRNRGDERYTVALLLEDIRLLQKRIINGRKA